MVEIATTAKPLPLRQHPMQDIALSNGKTTIQTTQERLPTADQYRHAEQDAQQAFKNQNLQIEAYPYPKKTAGTDSF